MNILITGGASGAGDIITRTIAADKQHTVFFTFNNSLQNAKKIESEFPNTKAIACDFANPADIESLENWISSGSDLDAIVHNAYSGDFISYHFHKTPYMDFGESFAKNIIPVIRLTQKAIEVFRKKKSGKIINILSAALVNKPPVGAAIYTANKAFHESLSKTWATENAAFGITSNSISPSLMRTSLTAKIDERIVEQIESTHPLKRLLSPNDVANAVIYLLRASGDINGINLVLNAGIDIA